MSVPSLVTRSMGLEPVSLASIVTGATGRPVSSVNSKGVHGETFPATSTCRTSSTFVPSTALNEGFHDWPLSTEYSTVAPDSTFPIVRSARLVIKSVRSVPVSLVSETIGSAAACVSSVKSICIAGDTPPSPSNCRTRTTLPPSSAVNAPLQIWPASIEYSIMFSTSTPVTANMPSEVIPSVSLIPVSFPSTTIGASNTLATIVLTIAMPGSTSM